MLMQQKSSNSINIFGFSLLRNGVKYDYSFLESLLSLKPIANSVYLALDDGEDTTHAEISKYSFIKIVPSVWDMRLQDGLVLSTQTNIALSQLRSEHHGDEDWGIYLQSDEVLHEDDYERIKNDLEYANSNEYDAISFRYLHFWQTHHQLAIEKNWYPQEIRAIKLNSDIVSYGDAQSFSNVKKVFQSEARIFHYGHVRDHSVYKKKMEDMSKLYNADETKTKYYNIKDREREQKNFLAYNGSHPNVMKSRIIRFQDSWTHEEVNEIYIIGKESNYLPETIKSINVKTIHWVDSVSKIPPNKITINTNPNWWDFLTGKTKVPKKMYSKAAHDWSIDFRLVLQLSEKKIGIKVK